MNCVILRIHVDKKSLFICLCSCKAGHQDEDEEEREEGVLLRFRLQGLDGAEPFQELLNQQL